MEKPGRTWRCGVTLTWLTMIAVVFFTANPCRAGTVSLTDPSAVMKAFTADGSAVITASPIKSLTATEFNTSLLITDYPGWTIKTPVASPGTFSVTTYKAGSSSTLGGANISVTYDNITALAETQQLRWVQIISTNAPLGGTTSPYIDPRPNDDTLPFYWSNAELLTYAAGKTLQFSDYAKRDAALLKTLGTIRWQGSLFLASYDGGTTLTPHDGLQWGFEMKSATQGYSSGKFLNPSGPNSSKIVVNGAGTNQVTYGKSKAPHTSGITFTAANFDPEPNDIFSVGKLTFSNYPTADGTEIDRLDLELSMDFINSGKNITLTTPLNLVSTINTGDDKTGDADCVSLTAGNDIYSFYVYENTTAEVDILGKLTASPVITGISEDKSTEFFGDTFVSDIIYNFELVGFGNLDDPNNGFVTDKSVAAPLPGTMGLLALGLSLTAVWRKRDLKRA